MNPIYTQSKKWGTYRSCSEPIIVFNKYGRYYQLKKKSMMAISGDELNKIDILCPNKTRFLCSYFYCATDTNLNSFVSWVNGNYYVINLDHFGHLKRKIKLFKDQFLDEKMQFFNDEDYLYAIYSSKTGVNIYKFEINNLD